MEAPLGRQLLLVAVLILVNAFFAAAEIAVISLNGAKIRHDAEEGDAQAAKLLRLVDDPTSFLSTIQIAITLAGFLASAFAADTFSDRLVTWLVQEQGWTMNLRVLNLLSVVAITLLLSYFSLVLGELVPKRIAMAKSDQVTRLTCGVVIGAGKLFKPVVWLLTVSTNGVLRLLGIDSKDGEESVSEDEIRLMVDIGEESGGIESGEAELIGNIFEFNDRSVAEVMVHRPDMKVVWLDDSQDEIIKLITESGLSRFPVCGDDIDDVRGILRTREYLINAYNGSPKTLEELVAPAYLVPETLAADVLLRDMQRQKAHIAVAVDEYGGTSGLITMEDLMEELFGEIYDEFDQPEVKDVTRLEDNLWRISGGCPLDDLSEALDVELPEDLDAETLGGLVYTMLTQIPADGDTPAVESYGLHIQVEQVADRRVEWALVSKIPPEDAAKPEDEESR